MSGERVFLDVMLQPNRPLLPLGLFLVLAAIAGISFICGVMFVLRGAWPVTPFFGADVALLAWALHVSTREARRREHLILTSGKFILRHVDPRGRETVIEANPYWLRVDHDDPERLGAELALVSKGERLVVGKFLGADERASLADVLRHALQAARENPT